MSSHIAEVAFRHLFRAEAPSTVRAWVPSCANGQTAHALAARLIAYVESRDLRCDFRIFGSERDANAIGLARTGHYTLEAHENAPPELRVFLRPVQGGFQLEKRIRDSVLFSVHDLKSDPPFSRLDIVLAKDALLDAAPREQSKLLETLHYALFPTGILILGESEVPADIGTWFERLDAGAPVFVARADRAPQLSLLRKASNSWPASFRDDYAARETAKELLLERYTPACLIVDERRNVVGTLGIASNYLHSPSGPPTNDLLESVAPELRDVVRTLADAAAARTGGRSAQAEVSRDGARVSLAVSVHPLAVGSRRFHAFIFLETTAPASAPNTTHLSEQRQFVERMRQELDLLKAEFRASSEELRHSVEELRVLNEELESANHNLELTRGHQQRINEELTSANDELRTTVTELESANLELRNFVFGPKFAVVMLDSELRVRGFTTGARDFFRLTAADRGRLLADLKPNFQYEQLQSEIERALTTGTEVEVQISIDERWFALRIVPFRSAAGRVSGVTLTFADISGQKIAELEVERLRARLATQQRWVERSAAANDSGTLAGEIRRA